MSEVRCDCADVPPTMPTCRDEHLIDCPVAVVMALNDKEAMLELSVEVGEAWGDQARLAEIACRNNRARAEAAFLRARHAGR